MKLNSSDNFPGMWIFFRTISQIAIVLLRMAARFTEKSMGSYEIRLVNDSEPVALFETKESEINIDKS